MDNAYWYCLLILVSLIFFGFALWKKADIQLFLLYTSIGGLAYLIEFVILVLFNSYVFYPNILKNQYYDNILGAIISDAFAIPMLAAFIGCFKIKRGWMIVIVGVYLAVEKLFLNLQIFEHYWWKIPYTGISLFFCFILSKKWYVCLYGNLNKWIQLASLYFTSLFFISSSVFVLTALLGLYHYHIGWFDNPYRDNIALTGPYNIFLPFLFSILVTFRFKWFWRMMIILLICPVDFYLKKAGILHLSNNWSIFYFTINYLIMLLILDRLNYILSPNLKNENIGGS